MSYTKEKLLAEQDAHVFDSIGTESPPEDVLGYPDEEYPDAADIRLEADDARDAMDSSLTEEL